MERFLLFANDRFYPAGGWGDFLGDFATKEAAAAAFNPDAYSGDHWWEVVDTANGDVVAYGGDLEAARPYGAGEPDEPFDPGVCDNDPNEKDPPLVSVETILRRIYSGGEDK